MGSHHFKAFASLVLLVGSSVACYGQSVNPALFSDMRWREIGPMRAGRTRALAGVPSQPATFYMGAVNGGVWKTTDSGDTWTSLWDSQPTSSIGAIAVSLSNPSVIYVGSGEGLARPDLSVGDGVYKSTDAGKTWAHLGLRDGQQIGNISIDPRNPDRVFVAVTGHPYGPNKERGLYRSTDGGKTFRNVLYVDEFTGASEVEIDPHHADTVYAGMWERQEGAWENGAWSGTHGGFFKSTDGGDHWKKLTGGGLPDDIIQVNVTVSPADSNRIYIEAATQKGVGFYRSDDGGKTWIHAPEDDARPEVRIGGGGDLSVPRADPRDPNTVYVASVVTWKSTDGGRTWVGLRGSPGGDDYQNIFINPNNPDIIALASDQGVIITQNGGQSWAKWYNQPTAQMYHVTADNAFPYRVCGGQQDSGSACVPSRSDDGRITFHDWHPAGIEEYGYAAPDPLDPDIVYGGKVTRYDRRTGQIENVEPSPLRQYRVLRTEPLMFSPVDPRKLYFATNTLWLTSDGGKNWKQVSPDLTREAGYALPPSMAHYKDSPTMRPIQRGVIYALGLSSVDGNRLWAGTDDGYIWTTTDGGGNWTNVTPRAMQPFWKVFNMDAGHFDSQTAYAAINTMRLDDMRPHLFRTHDGGKTWTEIDNGLPNEPTSTIREDPKQRGLLYAGTETQVYVSFDDGDHWQSLRLNMPASSVRDLQVKDDDLIAGTHGRGFLILDDLTPLRQIAAKIPSGDMHLYTPQTAIRIRNDMNPPTPWPPDMATGKNPPDGAILDYHLGDSFKGPLTLEVLDDKGNTIAHVSSSDPVPPLDPRYPDPILWARPPRILMATPGHHRFLWDMQYAQVPGMSTGPDADMAVPHDTPQVSTAPWVMPGTYTVCITGDGQTQTAQFKIVMDPRVKTTPADLQAQFDVSKSMYDNLLKMTSALHEITMLRDQLKTRSTQAPIAEADKALEVKLDAIAGSETRERGRGAGAGSANLTSQRAQIARLEHSIQSADAAPTTAQVAAAKSLEQPVDGLLQEWQQLKATDLKSLNEQLLRSHFSALETDTFKIDHDVEDQIQVGDEN